MITTRFIMGGCLAALLTLHGSLAWGQPLYNGFTYQGRLLLGGVPANGIYSFQFKLFSDPTNTSLPGTAADTVDDVAVSDGLFTVLVSTQPGAYSNAFNGEPRWLEIAARPHGGNEFTTLSPRQQIAATPHASFAYNASNAITAATATSVPWSALTGIPAGFADGVDTDTTYTAGAGLTSTGIGPSPTIFSVAPSGILSSMLASNAVTSDKIARGAVTLDKLDPDEAQPGDVLMYIDGIPTWSSHRRLPVAPSSIETSNAVAGQVLAFNGTVPAWSNVSWSVLNGIPAGFADGVDNNTTYTAGAGLSLSGTAFSIANGGVNNAQLANGAVNASKVDSAQVQLRVSGTAPAGSFIRAISPDGAVVSAPDNNTTYSAGAGLTLSGTTFSIPPVSVLNSMLADNSVSTAKLQDNSVIGSKIANNAVASSKLADGSVNTAKIAGGAVTLPKVNAAGAAAGQAMLYDGANVIWSNVPWSALSGIPAGFSDGVDNNTTYTVGAGLSLSGTTFSVAPSGITSSMLVNNAVTSDKIVNDAASLAKVSGGNLSIGSSGETYTHDHDIHWRIPSDHNHGVGWYGLGKLFANQNIDGPVLYGWAGGALGKKSGGEGVVLRWTASGTVGIGTAAPTKALDVRDGSGAGGEGGGIHVGGTGANGDEKGISFGDGDFVFVGERGADDLLELKAGKVYVNSSFVGIGVADPTHDLEIHPNGTTIANSWGVYSSRRWKTNIQTIQGALAKVEHLRGVTYDWKRNGKHDLGLIAEEVGEVIPEVVTYEANGKDAESVDYARLVAVLIEAVKEQQKEIQAQQTLIDEMRSEQKRLSVLKAPDADNDTSALSKRLAALERMIGPGRTTSKR